MFISDFLKSKMAVATTYQFNYDLTTSNNNIQQQRNIYLTIDDYMADISCPLLDVEEMLLQQRGCREASFSMHYKAKLTNRLLMNEVKWRIFEGILKEFDEEYLKT